MSDEPRPDGHAVTIKPAPVLPMCDVPDGLVHVHLACECGGAFCLGAAPSFDQAHVAALNHWRQVAA